MTQESLFSRRQVRTLNHLAKTELRSNKPNIGYVWQALALFSLPHKETPSLNQWVTTNRSVTITIQSGRFTTHTGHTESALPSGIQARRALLWISTEAVRRQSSILHLDATLSNYLRACGTPIGGDSANKAIRELQLVLSCTWTVETSGSRDFGYGNMNTRFHIAQQDSVRNLLREATLREPAAIKLNPLFFEHLLAKKTPVDLDALRALGGSSLSFDVYVWATYKGFSSTGRSRGPSMTWESLHHQFASTYKRIPMFRLRFITELEHVKLVYPEVEYLADPHRGLTLKPFVPHVKPRVRAGTRGHLSAMPPARSTPDHAERSTGNQSFVDNQNDF